MTVENPILSMVVVALILLVLSLAFVLYAKGVQEEERNFVRYEREAYEKFLYRNDDKTRGH